MANSSPPMAAVVTAGDAVAAKAIYGQSKAYLPVGGLPMVARLVLTLQSVPEVSEVWVVGDRLRLEAVFSEGSLRSSLSKPLHLVEQGRNLLENAWETYRKVLAQDEEVGRDPVGDEIDVPIFFLSTDLPFATSQELSAFARESLARSDCDYSLGLVPDEAMEGFEPSESGEEGIEVAFFNIREGRMRQSNLHFARPARIGNLYRIEEMYELRHQKKFVNMGVIALKLFFSRVGGPRIFFLYMVMHVAGMVDRWGFRRLADRMRSAVSMARIERTISGILGTRFRFLVTQAGGCAVDVDTEHEYDVVCARFDEFWASQQSRAEEFYGPVLEAGSSEGPSSPAPSPAADPLKP